MKKIFVLAIFLLSLISSLYAQDSSNKKNILPFKYSVEAAPEWTNLFNRTSGWFGADGIFSIPLSGVDKNNNALFFSRSVIPFHRDRSRASFYYKHIGIYAFRKNILMAFTQWETTPLEAVEKLEQLRYLENGVKIKMVLTAESPVSIDTPEDLERARKFI